MKKITFIAWVHFHRRTELIAQHLGATLHFVQVGQPGVPLQLPFRYTAQALRTWRILLAERPAIVLVQNPPIFCALVVYLYTRLFGGRFVIDSHTGAFVSPQWRWSLGLHRALSRRALTTLVHNRDQEKVVAGWRCPYLVVAFTPGDYSVNEPMQLDGRFNVAVISSFRGDEPTATIFEAAERLPEIHFYFTGDPNRLPSQILATQPDNCCLLGYLPYPRFTGLLAAADAIMTLTDRDHTLLMGGFEAVSMGKPLITSDWPVLRDYFSMGTIHIVNTVTGICDGVCVARAERERLEADMLRLRTLLNEEWARGLRALDTLFSAGAAEPVVEVRARS